MVDCISSQLYCSNDKSRRDGKKKKKRPKRVVVINNLTNYFITIKYNIII